MKRQFVRLLSCTAFLVSLILGALALTPARASVTGGSAAAMAFTDGRHIGGSDDLAALDAKGGLDPLLGTA